MAVKVTQLKVDAAKEMERNRMKAVESVEKSRNEMILAIATNPNVNPAVLQMLGIKTLDSSVLQSSATPMHMESISSGEKEEASEQTKSPGLQKEENNETNEK